MNINSHKSSFSFNYSDQLITESITHIFPYRLEALDSGIKYLDFHLNPNAYKKGIGPGSQKILVGRWKS